MTEPRFDPDEEPDVRSDPVPTHPDDPPPSEDDANVSPETPGTDTP